MIGPAALPVLFFVSGPLALVYEVLWQRRFALLFGGGATAAAAVLAAYFAGLGAGSHVFGRSAAGDLFDPHQHDAVPWHGRGELIAEPSQVLLQPHVANAALA